ncbi:DUF485 domain-containing protein [Methylobacterium nodulans]|uniref:DUF485 domain-containing protein n=1 Tax=Methylobacterium nodulans (strain LMG 21967 / CNCM I-2342 / ORS 2060) TaxID=460265 RepID=B8IW31_METNO|nr:DUF485 domain-containing protein [Methylobacterium nodulans]ACL62621.1 protein of unknown function DUF485 [Methylobacterium nodulans ORS 2060]
MRASDKYAYSERKYQFEKLCNRRSRVAAALSFVMILMYFSFMAMFAFSKSTMGIIIAPGLSLCILLGAGVIVGSFALCFGYVVWANRVYDPSVRRIMD